MGHISRILWGYQLHKEMSIDIDMRGVDTQKLINIPMWLVEGVPFDTLSSKFSKLLAQISFEGILSLRGEAVKLLIDTLKVYRFVIEEDSAVIPLLSKSVHQQ